MGRTWTDTNADAIRQEVNILKHDAGGTWQGRQHADLEKACAAVAELLELVQTLG